jgi:ubiquinone/menaquinone biosynthesis C-methylase UbiE
MALLSTFRKIFGAHKTTLQKDPAEAYDLWSTNYDQQPDNLMLHLDNQLFKHYLGIIQFSGKVVLDIGCGTGRHWAKIMEQHPAQLVGYDVSDGMLRELKKKFPDADTRLATDSLLSGVRDESADVIVSTLTIAHIQNMNEAISAWSRILKTGGHLIITDFHPAVLQAGGKRNFQASQQTIEIRNYVHPIADIRETAKRHDLLFIDYQEKLIDESVRHFYEKQQALPVYQRFRNMPIIYGLHFQKL